MIVQQVSEILFVCLFVCFPQSIFSLFIFGNFHCFIFQIIDSYFCILISVLGFIHWYLLCLLVLKFPLDASLYLIYLAKFSICWGFQFFHFTHEYLWMLVEVFLSRPLKNLRQLILTSLPSQCWYLFVIFFHLVGDLSGTWLMSGLMLKHKYFILWDFMFYLNLLY